MLSLISRVCLTQSTLSWERMESKERALCQAEHLKYPAELGKIRNYRSEREKLILLREAELVAAKKLIKNCNYYDRRACADFVKQFKVDERNEGGA
ncbi:unnamed protein product [Peronospora farinosa]|uniref:Uncharacterized protein n=1 Tax=Peronospora farinosa TaxID=134698 RepID=A0ABN8C281_9STRA|nr:unnamed protein product [Peronospora farinosa]